MLIEEQRLIHEDLERLEAAIADRLLEDPKHIRDRLARDHDISRFLQQIEAQSQRLLDIYKDVDNEKDAEVRAISTGDTLDSFQKEVSNIRDFHRRYPNEPVENLEKAYKKRTSEEQIVALTQIDKMFTGEEGFGRFFDLTSHHEQYLNLPNQSLLRRPTYLQYLDNFDAFAQSSFRREQKLSEPYFQYLKNLQEYLESFMRRTKPLENLDKLFANFDKEFDELWEEDEVPGWGKQAAQDSAMPDADNSDQGIWCDACQKHFKTETVFQGHLAGKKHKKAAQQMSDKPATNGTHKTNGTSSARTFKERAVAEKEFRIRKLAAAMQTERSDTKVNVERKAGMTDRERQQELEMLYNDAPEATNGGKDDEHKEEEEDKIYNPLKLPLAWDGKPIPYWLYKLHGLGVEFTCELCGNFVYMGRRAFDKHFNEPRHVRGLQSFGITNTALFREITGIEEAQALWNKLRKDKKQEKALVENVVQMEDSEGNVMPEKVYQDLLAQGIL